MRRREEKEREVKGRKEERKREPESANSSRFTLRYWAENTSINLSICDASGGNTTLEQKILLLLLKIKSKK